MNSPIPAALYPQSPPAAQLRSSPPSHANPAHTGSFSIKDNSSHIPVAVLKLAPVPSNFWTIQPNTRGPAYQLIPSVSTLPSVTVLRTHCAPGPAPVCSLLPDLGTPPRHWTSFISPQSPSTLLLLLSSPQWVPPPWGISPWVSHHLHRESPEGRGRT